MHSIEKQESHTITIVLIKHVFLKWGLPLLLLNDLGGVFESELMRKLSKILGVTCLQTSDFVPSPMELSKYGTVY